MGVGVHDAGMLAGWAVECVMLGLGLGLGVGVGVGVGLGLGGGGSHFHITTLLVRQQLRGFKGWVVGHLVRRTRSHSSPAPEPKPHASNTSR